VLFDICHPADVHLFRHIITHLEKEGHEITVTARPKDVTLQLLSDFGIPYIEAGTHYSSLLKKAAGLIKRDIALRKIMKKTGPDLVVGFASPYAAQMAFIQGIPSLTFNDTEKAFLGNHATHPFTTYLVAPECAGIRTGKRGLRFRGIFEQFYLSERFFVPNPGIKERLGIESDEDYAVLRVVAWDAAHDRTRPHPEPNDLINIIESLSRQIRVFVSSETEVPEKLRHYLLPTRPSEFHQVLSQASLYIGEGAKTASEAAIMGVPSILMNSASLGVLGTLKERGLMEIQPIPEKALSAALHYLENHDSMDNGEMSEKKMNERKKRVERFWKETVDVPSTLLNYIDALL